MDNPDMNSPSPGHLRKGSIVRVIERRSVNAGEILESWVLVEGNFRGWLKEDEQVVDIYDLKAQAGTAAVVMTR
jgi:hypothetical protein